MVAPPAKATSRFQLDAVDGPDGIAVAKSPGRMPPGLARHRRDEAGRTARAFRQRAPVLAQPEVAVQHLELLILGHRLQQQRSARVGVEGGVHPRRVAMRVGGIGQSQQRGTQAAAFHLERRAAGSLEAITEPAAVADSPATAPSSTAGAPSRERVTSAGSCAAPAPASV
ncbi:hypothetical protein G6F23_013835 [Rhizopus arrhizus]|nr:hypothetical protein G6F23_013835 [Rhizopus arrhizus]